MGSITTARYIFRCMGCPCVVLGRVLAYRPRVAQIPDLSTCSTTSLVPRRAIGFDISISNMSRYGPIAASRLPSMIAANPGMHRVIGVSGSTASSRVSRGRAAETRPEIRKQLQSISSVSELFGSISRATFRSRTASWMQPREYAIQPRSCQPAAEGSSSANNLEAHASASRSGCSLRSIPRFLAEGFALSGARQSAIQWLQVAIDRGFVNYPFHSQHEPSFEALRGDSAFKALLETAKHRWERFEV